MLFDAENTRAVVQRLRAHYAESLVGMPPLVVDPVCVSTSGHTLLQPEAVEVMVKELFPLATLVTPNKPEAELLLSGAVKIVDLAGMVNAAKQLCALGPRAALVKGGHIDLAHGDVLQYSGEHSEIVVVQEGFTGENMEILRANEPNLFSGSVVADVLYERDSNSVLLFASPKIESQSTHGTGCTLSAAIASSLAKGQSCEHFGFVI